MQTNFFRIESHLAQLRAAMTPVFPGIELDQVKEFVTFADYVTALELACDLYRKERKVASPEVIEQVRWIAEALSIDPGPLLAKLAGSSSP